MSSSIEGIDVLIKKLKSLDDKTNVKVMQKAAVGSIRRTKNKMKALAPISSKSHKTYKRNVVAPGFLKRSITHRTRKENNSIVVTIGVKKEAYYGVQFLDRGTKFIKPIQWFESTFEKDEKHILEEFKNYLKKNLDKL